MSKNGLPWYQRFPRDLIEGTTGMPYDAKMQYWALLDLLYLYNNALPDDANFICGTFNCSKQLWRKVKNELISRNKIEIKDGIISNKRASNVLKDSEEFSEKQSKNRSTPNKNKYLQTPNEHQTETRTQPPQPQPQEQSLEGVPPSKDKEEEGARASLSIFEEVMLAVGVDPAKPPKFWRGSAMTHHVMGWQLAYAMTDDEVIEVARLSRGDNPEPPDGPKALDRHMSAFAKAKASAKAIKPNVAAKPVTIQAPVDRAAVAAFWAEQINKGAYVSPSAIRPDVARDMLAAGLVTQDQLREKGIVA